MITEIYFQNQKYRGFGWAVLFVEGVNTKYLEYKVYIITAFLSERTNEIIKISTGLVFPYLIDF